MSEAHGNPELALRGDALTGRKCPVGAVATVTLSSIDTASWGADLEADYEIGSISKGITGLLYVDALERGEISAETTLEQCLPLAGTPLGEVTLVAASIHRSGLGALPRSQQKLRVALAVLRHGTNPYSGTVAELLDAASREVPRKPRARYSNLGFQLLGHAIAARAGLSYRDLVRTRLAEPLGLNDFYLPQTEHDLRANALQGSTASGKPRPPWLGEAIGPAGGIRSTIGDMARLTRAILDGTAPGIGALDPVATIGRGARIGAGWITVEHREQTITWHNGGTSGFRSWMGVDRRAGAGVVFLSGSFTSMDKAGFTLLNEIAARLEPER